MSNRCICSFYLLHTSTIQKLSYFIILKEQKRKKKKNSYLSKMCGKSVFKIITLWLLLPLFKIWEIRCFSIYFAFLFLLFGLSDCDRQALVENYFLQKLFTPIHIGLLPEKALVGAQITPKHKHRKSSWRYLKK